MTITAVNQVLRSRDVLTITQRNAHPKPEPVLHSVNDNVFNGPTPVQADGWEKSATDPANSAIVIDNGISMVLSI